MVIDPERFANLSLTKNQAVTRSLSGSLHILKHVLLFVLNIFPECTSMINGGPWLLFDLFQMKNFLQKVVF